MSNKDLFKQFISEYTVIAGILTWILSDRLKDLFTITFDTIIDPLFSIDTDNDGKPDLARIKKIKIKIFNVVIYPGDFIIELIKTIFITTIIYYITIKMMKMGWFDLKK